MELYEKWEQEYSLPERLDALIEGQKEVERTKKYEEMPTEPSDQLEFEHWVDLDWFVNTIGISCSFDDDKLYILHRESSEIMDYLKAKGEEDRYDEFLAAFDWANR